jgi:hypothetical protein
MKLRAALSMGLIACTNISHAQAPPVEPTAAPMTLTLSLAPGQIRAFKITVDQQGTINLAGSGQAMPLNTGLTCFAKLIVDKQNADGTWNARYKIGGMKMLMNGTPMNMPNMAKSYDIKGILNKSGGFKPTEDLSKVGGGGFSPAMSSSQTMNNVLGNLMILPDKPVSIGDTWTNSVPLPYDATGKSTLTINSKILGVDHLNGDGIVRIQHDTSGPINMSITQPMAMNISGTIVGSGVSQVSLNTGSPIDDRSTQHLKMDIKGTNPSGNGEQMNMALDMNVTSHVESQILAKTVAKPAAKSGIKKK